MLFRSQQKGMNANTEKIEEDYIMLSELSNKYYELLPRGNNFDDIPHPLTNLSRIKSCNKFIIDLLNMELVSKMFLGLKLKINEIHPCDYCYKAAGIKLEIVPEDGAEFKILKKYIFKQSTNYKISHIFRVERRGEYERFLSFEKKKNRLLLFHGTKSWNFLGILSQGLRVAPAGVQLTGSLYGNGIYFSDRFLKSINYCDTFYTFDPNTKTWKNTSLMLMCEVALGNIQDRIVFDCNTLNEGYDSLRSLGQHCSDIDKNFHVNNGMDIPLTTIMNGSNSFGSYTEYIVRSEEYTSELQSLLRSY